MPVEPKNGYSISFDDDEDLQKTEAGTQIRNITREGVPSISVAFQCNESMLAEMHNLKKQLSLTVKYYDSTSTATDKLETDVMFITSYKEEMLADTDDRGIWGVTFDLEDLGSV